MTIDVVDFARDAAWEAQLAKRRVLELKPDSPVAIKRDVHSFEVNVSARELATAFHAVMIDPTRRFGLVQVYRARGRLGLPFQLGERFQGSFRIKFSLADAVEANARFAAVAKPMAPRVVPWLRKAEPVALRIEDAMTSDYGEIVELDLESSVCRLKYIYLEGSYVAGSSTFIVEPTSDRSSRITQVFEYQEIHSLYVLWFGTSVLKMHVAVVKSQIDQAVELAGGRIVSTTIPPGYLPLSPDATMEDQASRDALRSFAPAPDLLRLRDQEVATGL